MAKVRIIKRYPNRKLYDTVDSAYVTLDDIAYLIKEGENIKVIDSKTQRDITSVTFAQIILEEEKRESQPSSIEIFKQLIQSSSNTLKGWFQFSFKGISSWSDAIRKYIDELVSSGYIRKEESHRAVDMIKDFIDHYIKPTITNVQNIRQLHTHIQEMQMKLTRLEKQLQHTYSYRDKTKVKKHNRKRKAKSR